MPARRGDYLDMLAGEMRAYEPSLRERIGNTLADLAGHFGAGRYAQQDIASGVRGIVDFIPGLGDVIGLDDARRDFQAGNYGTGAAGLGLAALGAIPGAGNAVAGAARKAVRQAAGRAGQPLPMDQASRMARAQEMGFRTDRPLYHGSGADFAEFDPAKAGSTTRAAPARLGVWTSADPEAASEFAQMAAAGSRGNAQIYPLFHRSTRPAAIDLDGTEKNLEIAATLADAFDAGYDAVMLRNYTTPSGKKGTTSIVVKDPSQLRSVFARFDPSKAGSRDLLASLAAAGAITMTTVDEPDT